VDRRRQAWQETLSDTSPVARAPADAASAINNEVALNHTLDKTRFAVAHVDSPLPFGIRGGLYLMDLDEDDSPDVATRNRQMYNLRHPFPGNLPLSISLISSLNSRAQRFGARNNQPDRHKPRSITTPMMAHVEAARASSAPWPPRVALQDDYATGDRSPTDFDNDRFDTLFGHRAFHLGPTKTSKRPRPATKLFRARPLRIEVNPDTDS